MGQKLTIDERNKFINSQFKKLLNMKTNKSEIENFKQKQLDLNNNYNDKNLNFKMDFHISLDKQIKSNDLYNLSLEMLNKLNENRKIIENPNVFNSSIDNSRLFDYDLNNFLGLDTKLEFIPFLNGNFCSINQIPGEFITNEIINNIDDVIDNVEKIEKLPSINKNERPNINTEKSNKLNDTSEHKNLTEILDTNSNSKKSVILSD